MSSTKKGTARAVLASVAVVAIAGLGFAAPAYASEADPSLTIQKNERIPGVDGAPPTAGPGLVGVTFNVQQVGTGTPADCTPIDVRTPAGQAAYQSLFPDAPTPRPAPECFVDPSPASWVTGDDGSVTRNVTVGVYLVTETDPGTNLVTGMAAPFYASVPMVDTSGPTAVWNYDPVYHPKNDMGEPTPPTKTIDDVDGFTVGDSIDWTISTALPAKVNGYTSVVITDHTSDSLDLTAVNGVTVGGVDLVEDTHYRVDLTDGTITFLDAGLDAINLIAQGNPAAVPPTGPGPVAITVSVTTEVNSVDGDIANSASVQVENEVGPGTPGPETPAYKAEINIVKHNESGADLDGAVFTVIEADENGECPAYSDIPAGASSIELLGNGEEATVVIGGPEHEKFFCAYETTAPDGYVLDQRPHISGPVGADGEYTWTIANVKAEGPDLPETGANGALYLTVGGIALIAVAAGWVLISRRRASIE